MGRKRCETTEEERKIIIRLHNQCKSLSEISSIVNRARSTVQSIIDRFGERKTVSNKRRSGRPRKINEYDRRLIIRKVKQNPRITAKQIATELKNNNGIDVSASTVRDYLRSSEYHGRVARKKYFVNETNRKKRLEFAKQHINTPIEYWNRVIFTDESKFEIFGSKKKFTVWRKKNTQFRKENLQPTIKHGGGSVLVWGCMSANGVGSLHLIEGIMNHIVYIDILKEHLHASANKMDLKDNFIFTHDNDPKHSAYNTRQWVLYNTPKYLQTPPQSPDINPIEHLWDYLEKKLHNHNISSKESLKIALLEEWNKINPAVTSNLVNSMPRRLEAIIKSKGNPTKY
ncbi:Transposable element Tcb1 transposase [Anthophora retusa]